ncbi:hypothetical protein C1752_00636 [Acaryochloris thomasi RCC1774]|uniref:Uncharacterized protein n=1 Tax=Acaryochloris thomasi RCC1774 TaxID=1764569 RepID=A0A2W1JX83_9CYAN|nr:hypothetical protein [Acaryochloris thomasi]PZD74955.1 hypothetical protein C1752_00636 [Acaryochloris thomasi RCC1774]
MLFSLGILNKIIAAFATVAQAGSDLQRIALSPLLSFLLSGIEQHINMEFRISGILGDSRRR